MWNTVLFDLDGTLTASGEGITKCVQYAMKKGWNRDIALGDLTCFVGPPLKESFMRFEGLTDEEADRAVALYRERYETTGIYENSLYGGIRELLEELDRRHFTLALASSKPTLYCRRILRYFGIDQYFTAVIGAEMNGERTEKSEVISAALNVLGMRDLRSEVVMIGDRYYDIEGAKENGIASIGVTYGYGSRSELEAVWPECVVDSPLELRNVLVGQALAESGARPAQNAGKARDPRKSGLCIPPDGSALFRVWRAVYPLLLAIVGLNGIGFLFMLVLEIIFSITGSAAIAGLLRSDSLTVVMTGVADAALIPIAYFFFRSDERARAAYIPAVRIPKKLSYGARDVAMVIALTLGTATLLNMLTSLLIPYDSAYEAVDEALNSPNLVVQIIAVGIIGPICEELIYRGLIYRRIRDYLGVYWAAVLSGVLFGISHGNLTQGVFTALFGIVLALLYEHYGSMKANITAHIANNVYACVASYIPFISRNDYMAAAWALLLLTLGALAYARIFRREDRVNVV